MNETKHHSFSREHLDAKLADVAKYQAAYEADIAVMHERVAANAKMLSELQSEITELATLSALSQKKKLPEAYERWVANYLQEHSPKDPKVGIYYKLITEAAFAAGVNFPFRKSSPAEHALENASHMVNAYLNSASKTTETTNIRKIKAGYYRRATAGVTAPAKVPTSAENLTLNLSPAVKPAVKLVAKPVVPPVVRAVAVSSPPSPLPPVVSIGGKGGIRPASLEEYAAVLQSILPAITAAGSVTSSFILHLFREECKVHWYRFAGKERDFEELLFKLCNGTGPLDCWHQEGGAFRSERYQAAGSPPPTGTGWTKIIPQRPVTE